MECGRISLLFRMLIPYRKGYFLVFDENDEIEENAFCRFLDCITAFIWAYAITNPGVNSLRTPVYAEMVKIIKGEEVTFSDFKFSEERYRAQITNYVFNNSRAITKSMIIVIGN